MSTFNVGLVYLQKWEKLSPQNKTLSDILSHRSCRLYKPDPIPEELLLTLFATAFSAPSKSDLQQACVIRIEGKTKQKRIADYPLILGGLPKLLFLWCGDSRRIRRLCEWRGHPFANDQLDAFMNAAVDAGIAMQTFIITAESVGLGCCPVSEIRDQIIPLSVELELPKWVFPVAGLCVGWPAEEPRISLRLQWQTTIHLNRYDDSELVEQVTSYDRRRESIDQTPPERQRMVEKYGISSEYG